MERKKASEAEVMEVDVVVEDEPEEVCLDDTSEEDEGKVGEPGSITNNFFPILFLNQCL